jgi:hypothetical protein
LLEYAGAAVFTLLVYAAVRASPLSHTRYEWILGLAALVIALPLEAWLRCVRADVRAHESRMWPRGYLGRSITCVHKEIRGVDIVSGQGAVRLRISMSQAPVIELGPWDARKRGVQDRLAQIVDALRAAGVAS